jgi:hypothetical protein
MRTNDGPREVASPEIYRQRRALNPPTPTSSTTARMMISNVVSTVIRSASALAGPLA